MKILFRLMEQHHSTMTLFSIEMSTATTKTSPTLTGRRNIIFVFFYLWCVRQDYCEILSLSQVTYHVPVLFPDENLGLLTTKHHQLKYYSLDLDSTTTVMESPSETWHFHLVLTGKTAETDKQNIIFLQKLLLLPKIISLSSSDMVTWIPMWIPHLSQSDHCSKTGLT